jgi:nucleoside-diphosphate-sugar epimerase
VAQAPVMPGAQYQQGDLGEREGLARALEGVTAVVHLAARLDGPGVTADEFERVNVAGTALLASLARSAGVERLVRVSSAGIYGDGDQERAHREEDQPNPATRYQLSKLTAEGAIRVELDGAATSWVMLRPPEVYGPGRGATIEFFRRVATGAVLLHGPAQVIVHPTFVTDVVEAVRLALQRPEAAGQVFNVAGERARPLHGFVSMVGDRLGHTPVQIRAPRWASAGPAVIAWALRRAGLPPPQRIARLARTTINRSLDTSKARTVLGFNPLPLADGLDRTIGWMRGKGLL